MEAFGHKLVSWALGGAGFATAGMLVALLVEWRLEIRDRSALAPFEDPERWVVLPDHLRLRVDRQGPAQAPGEPAYIMMSGLAGSLEAFVDLQRELARDVTTLSYDRAGTGLSDPPRYSGKPRDARAVADELASMLTAAQVRPPYVLVAHSISGLYARVFAQQHPDLVRAVVLLDPLTENEWSLVSTATSGSDQDFMFKQAPRNMVLSYLGLRRLKSFIRGRDPTLDAGLAVDLRGDHWRAAASEGQAVFSSFELTRFAPFPPTATLAILSAGTPPTADIAIVQRLHGEVARAAAQGVHEVLPAADHGGLLKPPHVPGVAAFIRKAGSAPPASKTH